MIEQLLNLWTARSAIERRRHLNAKAKPKALNGEAEGCGYAKNNPIIDI